MAITKAQTEAAGQPSIEGQTSFSPEGTQVREFTQPGGYDVFSVMPAERERFEIEDDRTVAWVRNPMHWEKIENSDRVREFMRERPGAKQVFDEDGSPVTNGDLLLMKYPTVLKEREEAARSAEYREYVEGEAPDSKPRTKERLAFLREQMTEQHRRDGMIGAQSPTSSLSYAEALGKYSKEAIDAEEARYRRGTRQSSFDNEDWAKMIDMGRGAERRTQKTASKSVAMGDSGFGRNPNSAVAQAAKRSGGK